MDTPGLVGQLQAIRVGREFYDLGAMGVRFGMCSKIDDAEALLDVGFDYVEWAVSSTVGLMDEADFRALQKKVSSLQIRPEAWNGLLPASIQVVGPEVDREGLIAYLETALKRVAELGGEVVVFGSGRSRTIPEGWSRDQGDKQFVDACLHAGEVASKYDITIVVEPLNKLETNLVNTVADGQAIVEKANHPSVQLLSDLYHVAREDEPLEDTTRVAKGSTLKHVHVATKENREIPVPGREEDLLRRYFEALHDGGYDSRVSVEGKWNLDEAGVGLEYMRRVWKEVSEER